MESNDYDFIIVSGDIGSEIAHEFYGVMDSFECPVYCVYGNWDNESSYRSKKLSKRCVLLHHNIERCGDLTITGFSGCPTHWGKNPIWETKKRAFDKVYGRVERRIQEKKTALYRKIFACDDDANSTLAPGKTKHLERAHQALAAFQKSKEVVKFTQAQAELRAETLQANKQHLVDTILRARLSQERLILVTHERVTKLTENGLKPLLHVFGHRHEFTFRPFKGTHYLNAAALDSRDDLGEIFEDSGFNPDGYCRLEVSGIKISVERRLIHPPRKPRRSSQTPLTA